MECDYQAEIIMSIKQAYNSWAQQYDTNENKTRDLEAKALKETLGTVSFNDCLEIGCGTGKNTAWLADKAKKVTAVDFSDDMLAKAKAKVMQPNIVFKQADITHPWTFGTACYDLVTFSLVLEHIEDLDAVFDEAAKALKPGGYVYIGELHPFKQYAGSKARFETNEGLQVVDCFTHHVSDFVQIPQKYGLALVDVKEHFDDDERNNIPRILNVLLKKNKPDLRSF